MPGSVPVPRGALEPEVRAGEQPVRWNGNRSYLEEAVVFVDV